MTKRIIEIVVLLVVWIAIATAVITIPLKSYNEYKDYFAQIQESTKPEVKPVLDSITAELKEGVKYFANDLADAKAEHFKVTAKYLLGEESYTEEVSSDSISVDTSADFYAVGGDITISYKGKTATVNVALEPVVLESIRIASSPYTINYSAGDSFDSLGMTVIALYNDGSEKVLDGESYSVDVNRALTTDDNKVTVSYSDGDVIKSAEVGIKVYNNLDNGAVCSLEVVDKAIVIAGRPLSEAEISVNAVYANGNRRPLSKDEYYLSGSDETTVFGKKHSLIISYAEDLTIITKADVIVRQTVQGESGVIVGGSVKTEAEYKVIDGVITQTENSVKFAGGFSETVLKGGNAYIVFSINSATDAVGSITMRCANSYNVFANGVDKTDGYVMKPLQINTILDLTINGREVSVPASVVLKGCGPYVDYAPLYGIYYEFTFENIQLDAGVNEVKFNFKHSTVGATNCWGESPSTLNIDYVNFDTQGDVIPENYTITGLDFTGVSTVQFGTPVSDFKANVVGITDRGQRVAISEDLYDIRIEGLSPDAEVFSFGKFTVIATLKSNPEIQAQLEFVTEEFQMFEVLHAGVEIRGNKVYYVFTGECAKYDEEDVVFFDGSAIFGYTVSIADYKFEILVDVTDLAPMTIYPHLSLAGVNYDNGGANQKGDIRGRGLKYTEGERVSFGGKTYIIATEYSMPTLVITEGNVPTAVKNPDFVSDKNQLGHYVWGSLGVSVNGGTKSNDDEFINGIGGLDKVDRSVSYTFLLTKSGKVDFVWNIAGNAWNGSGNNGLANAGENIKVMIDDKVISFAGISLPAGSGTATDIWWNLQQIVIEDVELSAGVHTFTCVIMTKDQGLNVGSMDIYFE